jgi:hypothetical protein
MDESPGNLTVFVSYSWDSEEHQAWVKHLADAIDAEPDLEVTFDQYDLFAGKDLTHFMERGLECERVVIISTPEYVRKARERTGGVGYETSLITADLVRDMAQDKFIPVLRQGDTVPSFLQTKLRVDFRETQNYNLELTRLIAAIRRQPPAQRPAKRVLADRSSTPLASVPMNVTLPGSLHGVVAPAEDSEIGDIDKLFSAADASAAAERREKDRAQREADIYSSQVRKLVASVVDSIQQQAEELDNHPRMKNKAAIMPRGTEITIRRASTTGMPDRRIEFQFRFDLGRVSWSYEVSPNPVYMDYTRVESGECGFVVNGETLRLDGFEDPEQFAARVLAQYRADSISDAAKVANHR